MTVSWGVSETNFGGVHAPGGVASFTYNLDVGTAVNTGSPGPGVVVVLTIMGYNYHSGLDNTVTVSAPGWNVVLDPMVIQDHWRIEFNGGKACVALLWRRYPGALPIVGAESVSVTVGRAWTFGDNLTGWPEWRAIWDRSLNAVADPKFATPNYYRAGLNGGATMPATNVTPGMPPDPGADGVVIARSAWLANVLPSGTPTFAGGAGGNFSGRSAVRSLNRTTTAVSVMPSFLGGGGGASAVGARLAAWWGYSVRGVPADHCTMFEGVVTAVSGSPNVQLNVASSAFPDPLSSYYITFADSSVGLALPASSLLSAGPWNLGAIGAGEYVKYQIVRNDGAHIDGSCVMRATDTTFGLYWDLTVQCTPFARQALVF